MLIQLLQEIAGTLNRIEKHLRSSDPKPEETPAELPTAEMPEHVSIAWIIKYLDVGRSTFYRNIKDRLLFHVRKIGNRPFYLKADVKALMVKHEKGAWTFSKLAKKAKKSSLDGNGC